MMENTRKINLNLVEQIAVFLMLSSIIALSEIRYLFLPIQLFFFLIMTIRLFRHRIRKVVFLYLVWGTAFFIWGLVSTIWAVNIDVVIVDIKAIAQVVLIGFFLIVFMDTEEKSDKVLKYFIFGAGLLVGRLVLQTDLSLWGTERLGAAIGYNSNSIGMVLAYASLFSLYLGKKNNNKTYYFVTIIFIVISLFTGSRKAFFLCLGGISMILLLTIKKRQKVILLIPLIFLGGLIAYNAVMNVPILYSVLGNRIEGMIATVTGQGIEYSTLYRMNMINKAWELFYQHPFIGYGFANFAIIGGFGVYSHNNYMELLTGGGLIALVIYYSLPIYLLLKSLKQWFFGNVKYAMTVILIVLILVIDFALVSYYSERTQIVLAIAAGNYFLNKLVKS